MKVILVGYPKTGTKSLAAALRKLGYTVYDILEHFQFDGKTWAKLLNEGGSLDDFRRMYNRVDAAVDAPVYYFWEEIHKAFPNAKIILTIRDEDSWYQSWSNQIAQDNASTKLKLYQSLSPTGWQYHKFVIDFQRVIHGFNPSWIPWKKIVLNEMIARKNFRQHNSYVKQTAPANKLLVYNIGDGWAPICEFLNLAIPNKPFPHKNKKASFYADEMNQHPLLVKMKQEANMTMSALAICGIIFTGVYLKWTW